MLRRNTTTTENLLQALEDTPVCKSYGCGYFLATVKPPKNQVILNDRAPTMVAKWGVIGKREEYPRV
jgi:hypothetical protein